VGVWYEMQSIWSVKKEGECSKFRSRGYLVASRVMCLEWEQGGRCGLICRCAHRQGPTLLGWSAQRVRQRGNGVISEPDAQGNCDTEKEALRRLAGQFEGLHCTREGG
jgi:hypothetical protein